MRGSPRPKRVVVLAKALSAYLAELRLQPHVRRGLSSPNHRWRC